MANDPGTRRADPRIGTILDRKYRIDRILGIGARGSVFAAWHLNLERPVAIKILHAATVANPRQVERFRFEAEVMSMLGHPNIVRVTDFRYSSQGEPYLVMDLVNGETLRQRLKRGPLPVGQVIDLYRPICEAIAQAHKRGVIHRDLKPDNLMIERGEQREVLKILDFGTSKLLSPDRPVSSVRLDEGTPFYMAPERLENRPYDHRVDIFSLGAILYEMLSGQMAFGGDSPMQAMFKITREEVPPLQLPDKHLSQALDEVVNKACQKNPEDRYATASELGEALARTVTLSSRPTPGLPSTSFPILRRPQAPGGLRQPKVPYLLSKSTPLSAGVKPALLQIVVQHLIENVGRERLERHLGPDFLPGLRQLVLTDWVDGVELQRLLACANELMGRDTAARHLGRVFADVALDTIYRSLLVHGEPDLVARRIQVILRQLHSEGESAVTSAGPGQFEIHISGLRTMDQAVAGFTAGFIERYLEKAGADSPQVLHRQLSERGRTVWEFLLSYVDRAPPTL